MEQYKAEFIEFMVRSGVLTFGDFVTKSGRRTPFFINTGNYDTGAKMARLGGYYARVIHDRLAGQFDCLFGPAYKGIPLAVAASVALARDFDMDVPFCFNRKEVKDHGEGGGVVGHKPAPGERMVIVEDVTTAGTSIRESVALFEALGGLKLTALVVSVDRQERGAGEASASAELRDELGIMTLPIVTLDEVVEHLHGRPVDGRVVLDDTILAAIKDYRARYGAKG